MNRFNQPAFNRISTASQRRKAKTIVTKLTFSFVDEVVSMPFCEEVFYQLAAGRSNEKTK